MHKLSLVATSLLASSLFAQGVPEAAEPNNTTLTAQILAEGDQAYGDITSADDDWFQITLAADSDYLIWTGPGAGAAIGDTIVALLDSTGTTVLAGADDGNTATHGFYSVFQGTLPAGVYYLSVTGWSTSTVGSYTLDVVLAAPGTYFLPVNPLTPVAEAPEDNDPRNVGGISTISAVDTTNSGNISVGTGNASYTDPSADYDFYEITVATAGQLTMETVGGATAPAMTDTVLFFADAAHTLLAFDDDSGGGLFSLMSLAVSPGNYNVVVKGWDAGNYTLEVSLTATLPSGSASVAIAAGGCAGTAGTPALSLRLASGAGAITEMPVLGSEFFVDGSSLPASTLVIHVIGLGLLPSPFDLGAVGAPGCFIEVDPLDQSFAFSDASGNNYWGLRTPSGLSLIGLPLAQQLAVLDPAANALGVTSSNVITSVTGITH